MIAHRGDDHLLGHFERFGIERAADADRPLAEVDDLGDQRVVGPHAQAIALREPRELVGDGLLARVGIDDHVRRVQRGLVRDRGRDLHRVVREKAMTAAVTPGGVPGPLYRDDLGAQQRDEPLHRPHERGLAPAPAHRLRPRDAGRELDEQRRQQRAGILPGDLARRDRVQALLAGDFFLRDRGRVDAVLRGEPLPGLRQRAVRRERGGHRRTDDLVAQIRLALGELAHDQRDPARRAEHAHAGMAEPRGRELGLDLRGQLDERARQHLGRNLLAADLEQQISRHGPSPARAR